jgi:hypothetical protein
VKSLSRNYRAKMVQKLQDTGGQGVGKILNAMVFTASIRKLQYLAGKLRVFDILGP